ncbi:MAG: hypothetical protein ACRD3D_15160 [Terriglobia bacterium]
MGGGEGGGAAAGVEAALVELKLEAGLAAALAFEQRAARLIAQPVELGEVVDGERLLRRGSFSVAGELAAEVEELGGALGFALGGGLADVILGGEGAVLQAVQDGALLAFFRFRSGGSLSGSAVGGAAFGGDGALIGHDGRLLCV